MNSNDDTGVRRRALRLGARVKLLDLRLRRIESELHKPTPEGAINVELEVHPAVSRVDQLAIYDLGYSLVAKDSSGGDVLTSELALSLVYELPGAETVSDGDLAAFGSICVVFAAHPYLREILQSLTGRMGLPPLTLDLMQLPLDDVMAEA